MTSYAMRWISPYLPSAPARILDLGCGTGEFVTWLEKRAYDSFGVDLRAEETDRIYRRDIRAFLNSGALIPFDALILWDVLEHVPLVDVTWTLERCAKVLRPHGKLIIRTPNAEGLFGTRLFFSDMSHTWCYSRQLFAKLLKDAGFKTWSFYEDPIPVHGVISFMRWLVWWLLSDFHRLLFAAETGELYGIMTSNIIVVATI